MGVEKGLLGCYTLAEVFDNFMVGLRERLGHWGKALWALHKTLLPSRQNWQGLPVFWQALPIFWQALPVFTKWDVVFGVGALVF
ncbi:MAG: hypothetical protein IKT26_02725 [Bacteroidaceae bacterium]|nr:hypothetical protein [Bacteroidaceae bacterium]